MKYNAITPIMEENGSNITAEVFTKYFSIKNIIVQPYYIVEEVLDADSLKVKQEFGQNAFEIRLYGIDAPEIHFSRKMREDEAKSGVPASILQTLGLQSLDFVLNVCPPGTRITLLTEPKSRTDFWLRDLAYVILPTGECLNELILQNGWAKATSSCFCAQLPYFQYICFQAQKQKKGIYSQIEHF